MPWSKVSKSKVESPLVQAFASVRPAWWVRTFDFQTLDLQTEILLKEAPFRLLQRLPDAGGHGFTEHLALLVLVEVDVVLLSPGIES